MRIRMRWGQGEVMGVFEDTPTARKVYEALPCSCQAHTWGQEVYFELPVQAELEDGAQQVVDPGTICFWVEGAALALPFGRTPISQDAECRLVTACNVLGKLEGDPAALGSVQDGDAIHVEQAA